MQLKKFINFNGGLTKGILGSEGEVTIAGLPGLALSSGKFYFEIEVVKPCEVVGVFVAGTNVRFDDLFSENEDESSNALALATSIWALIGSGVSMHRRVCPF